MESAAEKQLKIRCRCLFGRVVIVTAAVGALLFGGVVGQAAAGQVVLAWDANTEPDIAGYKIYYGTVSGTYGSPVTVGNVTTFTVSGLADGQKYYFSVSAYDTFTNESGYSNEVSYTVAGVPEINLVGNTVSIVDGDTTPLVADHTDFGGTDIAAGTVTRTFTIQNTGSGMLTLSGAPLVAVGGASAADFTVTVQPAASITAAGSTTFSVSFNPSAAGARTATLSIASNDTNENPYDFAIQGSGTTMPEINLVGNATSIVDGDSTPATADFTDFGGADVTGATVVRTFTIQNTGSGALSLSGTPLVAVSGATADFTVTAQPATSVVAGGFTTFTVTFDPSAAGTRTATLTIANNDTNESPYDFTIQGAGTASAEISLVCNANPIPDDDTTPSTADCTDFGGAKLSGGIVTRTFTIYNTGTGALALAGTPLVAISGADFTVTVQPAASVAASSFSTFTVAFDPSVAGTRTATLAIVNSDANENPYNFAIQGRGVAPPAPPTNIHISP